jgi:hypothetical protein
MPQTTRWVDELREAFGREVIDEAVREGVADARNGRREQGFTRAGFFASENGETVGAPVCASEALGQGSNDGRGGKKT